MPDMPGLLKPTTARRKIFFLALGFFFTFGFSNVSYFLPVYYKQIGISSSDAAGWLVAAFYITSVISRPFLGNVINLLGFRKTFYAAGLLGVTSSIGIILSGTNFIPALLSRGVLGVGSSLFQIGLATYQAIAFKPEERGRAFSLIMAGGIAPMMTLVPIADYLLQHKWNTAFILFPGLICLGAAIVTPLIPGLDETELPQVKRSARGTPLSGFADCFRIKPLRVAFLAVFLFSVTDAVAAFMGAMTEEYGLMASFFLSSNAIVGVMIRLFCGRVLDRYPRNRLSVIAIAITSSALLFASFSPSRVSLMVLGMSFGVGMGFGFPLHLALVSDYAPAELQPQAVSFSWFLIGLGFAFVPLLSGWLAEISNPVTAHRLIVAPTLFLALGTSFLWRGCGKR